MACVLTDGNAYIGTDSNNSATIVNLISKALVFANEEKALNYRDNLKAILKKRNWCVAEVAIESEDAPQEELPEDNEIGTYTETELERSGFDILKFFNDTIKTVSQLSDYANNMACLEREYNQKILDIRHYKRDENTKLNAVQLQRLEQFEIQLERERYECKSNCIIAKIFLADLDRLKNSEYLQIIESIKNSEYKPRIFTYEMLDAIVGKKSQ